MNKIKKFNQKTSNREANLLKAVESILPQKSKGGQLISTALSLIPGYGQVLSPVASMVDSLLSTTTQKQNSLPDVIPAISNPYGKLFNGGPIDPIQKETTAVKILDKTVLDKPKVITDKPHGMRQYEGTKHFFKPKKLGLEKAFGGVINNDFKQYDTGSHSSGNDLSVDHNGNANIKNVSATVQNKENSFKIDNIPYVMSDVLINPKTGNTFNVDAAKTNKKYPEARFREDEKNTLTFNMKRLASLNDAMRAASETMQKYEGGPISKFVPKLDNPSPDQQVTMMDFIDNPTLSEGLDTTTFGTEIKLGTNLANAPVQNKTDRKKMFSLNTNSSPSELTASDSNKLAIALKAAGLGKSVADSLTSAEKETPILPDYQKANDYLKSANIDYSQAKQDAQGVSNIAASINRSLSSNAASFQGREQARLASLQDSLSRISEQQNNAQSQLNVTKSQFEQNKALDTANRLAQNRINNQQNQANANYADQKLFTELSEIGTQFNKYSNHLKELQNNKEIAKYYISEGLNMINSNLTNFKLDPAFVEKLKSGASIDDLIKFFPNEMVRLKVEVDNKQG